MRYLLYYPMFHYSSISDLEEVIRLSRDIGKEKEAEALANADLPKGMDEINESQHEFIEYLKGQEPFNRVYWEGNLLTGSSPAFELDESGEKACLDYLIESKATFEKSESLVLFFFAGLIARRIPKLWNWAMNKREEYVSKRIDTSLQDGERGLLLYGTAHLETLNPKLSSLDLKLEVYMKDYNDLFA